MATVRSPSTPSSIPTPQSKKSVFQSTNASRRQSTSAVPSSSFSQLPQGIGYSPSSTNLPTTPASTGIPAFRTLRSLLPFGPNKNATPLSPSVSTNATRSPFSNFGSMRKSMTKERERKSSLSNEAFGHVIAIEKHAEEESGIRRSVSLPRIEKPLPAEPFEDPFRDYPGLGFGLRTPSPGPPLSAELSTIIEADSSGVSKNLPALDSPTHTQNLLIPKPSHEKYSSSSSETSKAPPDVDTDASALDLSDVASQVRSAMLESASSPNEVKQWHNANKAAVIIDADEQPDVSLHLDAADPDLLALLSPNSIVKTSPSAEELPITPTTPTSPASRLPRSRQASSFLPRLRSNNSPASSPTSRTFTIPSPSPTTPSGHLTPKASPVKPMISNTDSPPGSPSTSTPARSRRSFSLSRQGKTFTPSSSTSSITRIKLGPKEGEEGRPRTLRQAMLSVNTSKGNVSAITSPPSPSGSATLSRPSLDTRRPHTSGNELGLGRPSLEMRRGNSFDSRLRPVTNQSSRSSTSPERTDRTTPEADSSPSPEEPRYRPSFDSSVARPSLDSGRGSSAAGWNRERQRTPSLHVTDVNGDQVAAPPSRAPPPPHRSRKRSMSVQERLGRGRMVPSSAMSEAAALSRPGSSLSAYGGSRRTPMAEVDDHGPSKMEWLGPRTVKAFRAAGLLDFERDKEKDSPRGNELVERRNASVSGVLAPSPLSAGSSNSLNRFASLRSASDYNPTHGRAASRMAFSEAGGSSARRGSDAVTAYGQPGLMDSPTFTGSSGSRGRDTPKSSISTAPTSLSDAFGYLGRDRDMRDRDREREREREEIREMKEQHATEMAALLGALSDSQRTARVLREENAELRDRLDRLAGVAQDNVDLRKACIDLRRECEELRKDCTEMRREVVSIKSGRAPASLSPGWGFGNSGHLRTPVGRPSPLAVDVTPRNDESEEEEVYDSTMIIHDDIDDDYESPRRNRESSDDQYEAQLDEVVGPASSAASLKRRLSNGSSIFPTLPSNMSMLMHDDIGSQLVDSNRSSADHSQYRISIPTFPPASKPIPTHSKSPSHSHSRSLSDSPPPFNSTPMRPKHQANKSVMSISPTTANFSFATGSPGSLYLRPEHEALLGDMESLDLGANGPELEVNHLIGVKSNDDDW